MVEEYRTVQHDKPFQYEKVATRSPRGCAWIGPGCHLGCGVIMYQDADGKLAKCGGDPEGSVDERPSVHALP